MPKREIVVTLNIPGLCGDVALFEPWILHMDGHVLHAYMSSDTVQHWLTQERVHSGRIPEGWRPLYVRKQ